jgi:DNA mismatch repair protein MutS2
LKIYAETTPDVANAAMEFNEITLQPTYRLIHGLAGASSGLKIAERLQLPASVLQSAVSYIDARDIEAAHYVEELKQRVLDLEQEKARFEKDRRDFEQWKQREADQLAAEHKQEIERVERKLEHIVQQMSDRASRELQSAGEESFRKFQRKLQTVKAEAAREVNREREKSAPVPETPSALPTPQSSRQIAEGQKVRILSLGVTGAVASVKDGDAEVLMGNIKLRRPLDDLEVIEQNAMKVPKGVHISIAPKQLDTNEINLIGRKVDEAVEMADKFLDDAVLAQLTQVRIIHGMGTGALRQAISDLLGKHPHVSSFEHAPYAEGGRGVTVVTLRD